MKPMFLTLGQSDPLTLVMGSASSPLELTVAAGGGGNANVVIDTTAHWAERADYVPRQGTIVIYSDRYVIEGVNYPGLKVGDGVTVVGDLPFLGDGVEITYAGLPDKPQINGITLVGNKTMTELLSDGLIINGGDATGYEPPVIPTGVPYAEGVGF